MSIFSYKYYEKLKQKKYRREIKKFLIEGDNLVFECLESVLPKANNFRPYPDFAYTVRGRLPAGC